MDILHSFPRVNSLASRLQDHHQDRGAAQGAGRNFESPWLFCSWYRLDWSVWRCWCTPPRRHRHCTTFSHDVVHLLRPARRHCLNIFSLLHKKAKTKRKNNTKTTLPVSVHFYVWRVWPCVSLCVWERRWVGLGVARPLCDVLWTPPLPFLHSCCLRPSYSSKKHKGRYCIHYWLWDGNHLVFPAMWHAARRPLLAAACSALPVCPHDAIQSCSWTPPDGRSY